MKNVTQISPVLFLRGVSEWESKNEVLPDFWQQNELSVKSLELRFLYLAIQSSMKVVCVDMRIQLLFHTCLLMDIPNHKATEVPAHKMTASNKNISLKWFSFIKKPWQSKSKVMPNFLKKFVTKWPELCFWKTRTIYWQQIARILILPAFPLLPEIPFFSSLRYLCCLILKLP